MPCVACEITGSKSLTPTARRGPTPAPIAPITMQTLAALLMIAGLAGAFWYCLTTTLDDMTRADCNAGHVRACQALQQP